MGRVSLIIDTFTTLLKLEHHRNFLESCNVITVVPFGLRTKKLSSCLGEESQQSVDSLRSILAVSESQLVTLMILHDRKRLPEAKKEDMKF